MLTELVGRVNAVWQVWNADATVEQRQAFWGEAEDLKDHLTHMYELGEDAAEDVVAMGLILTSLVKRLLHPEEVRALPKPLDDACTPDDLAARVLAWEDLGHA